MSEKVLPPDLADTIRADFKARIKEARRAVQIAVQLHGPRVVASVITSTSPEPVDRGTYKRTWYVVETDEGVIIYNNSPHAPIIEAGRRPGGKMPPVNLIAAWVKRKGIADGAEAQGIAWAVARSIAKKGQVGKWILKRSQKLLDPLVLEAVAQSARTRKPTTTKSK